MSPAGFRRYPAGDVRQNRDMAALQTDGCNLPWGSLGKRIYGHSRFCNTDFDDKLACLNLSG
ncbi:hypothetical protein, partial [Klebsiella pneumoniae]|uniref:hypothetical protein n=1 Tax=Klebsiella pneumoniae TaxID=573 RepID=UPI001C4F938D